MKNFIGHAYNHADARVELDEFSVLLSDRTAELGERKDIQPKFYTWKNVLCLLGMLDNQLGLANMLSIEFDYFGRLSPDIVIGKEGVNRFVFVELEGAKKDSIFVDGGRKYKNWSKKFNDGLNQIVDWFWLADQRNTDFEFAEDFGSNHISKSGMLIIGRDAFLDRTPRDRLRWDHRRKDTSIGTCQLTIVTYDALLGLLEAQHKVLGSMLPSSPSA